MFLVFGRGGRVGGAGNVSAQKNQSQTEAAPGLYGGRNRRAAYPYTPFRTGSYVGGSYGGNSFYNVGFPQRPFQHPPAFTACNKPTNRILPIKGFSVRSYNYVDYSYVKLLCPYGYRYALNSGCNTRVPTGYYNPPSGSNVPYAG